MSQHLLLTVRFHGDGQGSARFHGMAQGAPEWPPTPARVFQALVAGVARGNRLPDAFVPALEWLERLPPPVVAAPHRKLGQSVSLFVPNNDADSVPDPRDVSGIRAKKVVRPSLFAEDEPLLYAWPLTSTVDHASAIVEASADLYQLGRGVDMAWADGELIDDDALQARLEAYRGTVHHPELGARGERMLACPVSGSLTSLLQRYRAPKLQTEGTGKSARILFTNPPKPRFLSVSYERARKRATYELRDSTGDKPWPWALHRVVKLVEKLRDEAADRLKRSLPGHDQDVEGTLIGRKADRNDGGSTEHRARIVPLPSIGSVHADHSIRRFVLDIPSGSPLPAADLEWAFSGLQWAHPVTGEVNPLIVTRNDDDEMLEHYVGPSRRWRSVTPVALPESAQRRRIEPTRTQEEAKGAPERQLEEDRAVAAVHQALRHAGIRAIATHIRVQREPFEKRGSRAELFAEDTRFAKERLWHVELTLDRPVDGPVVIGDGRFLGLGIMVPTGEPGSATNDTLRPSLSPPGPLGLIALAVLGAAKNDPVALARALRRAVMARVQDEVGADRLKGFFSGHQENGHKLATEQAGHISFQWDPKHYRLLVISPHWLERRAATREERRHLKILEAALEGLTELRAGEAGRFGVRRITIEPAADPLLETSRHWTSLSPYLVTRHLKRVSATDAIVEDVLTECTRRSLPRPEVTVIEHRGIPNFGVEARIRLDFATAVTGPIILGRSRFLGGGLFAPER